MRKLWSNVIAGQDMEADVIFHYHQELPKYVRGYHRTTKEDCVAMGALVYRCKFGEDKSNFANIP